MHVSLTVGTGRRGSELWKLYSIGFLPEKTFTSSWEEDRRRTLQRESRT